jgi:hypothetical protein
VAKEAPFYRKTDTSVGFKMLFHLEFYVNGLLKKLIASEKRILSGGSHEWMTNLPRRRPPPWGVEVLNG